MHYTVINAAYMQQSASEAACSFSTTDCWHDVDDIFLLHWHTSVVLNILHIHKLPDVAALLTLLVAM